MLDSNLKNQVKDYLQLLEKEVVISISLDDSEDSKSLKEFIDELLKLSDKLKLENKKLKFTPSFSLSSEDVEGITFAGIPLWHEFESFILAVLQVGGRAPKLDEVTKNRIKSIEEDLNFETIISLSCHNCPEVVQGLNIMSVLNPKIKHSMIDGAVFREYVDELGILAVPTTYLNGEVFNSGKISIDEILDKISDEKIDLELEKKPLYDMLVIGGGPAGATAAIYGARKGIKTAIVAKEFGGQVKETLGIENITGLAYTEGPKFMEEVKKHLDKYNVEVMDKILVTDIVEGSPIKLITDRGELSAKTIIIATGAKWRLIGVPGEIEFRNKGVAYCTHCDGPLFKNKKVTVIGGGNSGIEAAVDMASIASEVLVLEFLPELKADLVLQEKLKEFKNVKVVTNAETQGLYGEKVLEKISYKDRISGEIVEEKTDGCFIQVGLVPMTEWINKIEKNPRGEIIVDNAGATNIEGIYGAGDCTNSAFKQIVIAEGSGATAALGAYNYLMTK
ncbi:alkyl hydroperoxide reductase subunit F [Peptoniphilus senegalensis]|uniref:alkyl hydroperoxide reductase subunit F n=1 Tax=Peptoniphilus senegalensis TaxID=1465757 RepID=UPI00399A1342